MEAGGGLGKRLAFALDNTSSNCFNTSPNCFNLSFPALMPEGTKFLDAVRSAPPYKLAVSPRKDIHQQVQHSCIVT